MPNWLLPEYIQDMLPDEAWRIEQMRAQFLELMRVHGYQLVAPPMLEYVESLLIDGSRDVDLRTFKLVDQLSGRTLALRADITPQVARIDAHLLNRKGVTRLCYCGPVLHTWPDRPHATREPLQFGAEIYGHAGVEADLEALELARACLSVAGVRGITVDLADVRIVRALLKGVVVDADMQRQIFAALAAKDASELSSLTRQFPQDSREGLLALLQLYGDKKVLFDARNALYRISGIDSLLANLEYLAGRIEGCQVLFDLSDLRGYAYYSGARFAIYADGASDALARGGRYDEVGSVFGRNRPAAGFSLDVKQLVLAAPARPLKPAIRAPWGDSSELRATISELRSRGETVVCVLPGHESEADEFDCDRELASVAGKWTVVSIG